MYEQPYLCNNIFDGLSCTSVFCFVLFLRRIPQISLCVLPPSHLSLDLDRFLLLLVNIDVLIVSSLHALPTYDEPLRYLSSTEESQGLYISVVLPPYREKRPCACVKTGPFQKFTRCS